MTVKELISQLEQCDPNADVILTDCKYFERKNYYTIILEGLKVNCDDVLDQVRTSLCEANVIVLH